MSNSFTKLGTLDFHEIFDLIDIVQDNLDDLWRQDDHKPYPQVRMSHLMDTIAAAISRAIQGNLKGKTFRHMIYMFCLVLEVHPDQRKFCICLISLRIFSIYLYRRKHLSDNNKVHRIFMFFVHIL